MIRFLSFASIALLVCAAAVGGYFAGLRSERLRVRAERTNIHQLEAERNAAITAKTTTTDGNDSAGESGPIPLRARLADAQRLLSGGMINIASIVDVFDSMGEIDPTEITEAMEMIDAMPNFQQKNLLYMALLTRWADSDGAGAADYVSENFSAERKAGMLNAVFSNWAANEPLVAWKWLEANRDQFTHPNHEHQLVRSLYQGLATRDFGAAMARLKLEGDFDLKTIGLDALGATVAATGNRDEFFDYATSLENRDQRVRAINSVLGHLAHSDPVEASSLVETLEQGKDRAEAAKQVANSWFETEPHKASAWFLNQVPDDQMPNAVRDITHRWLRRDPNAAAEFLSTFDPGETSDPARATLSQGIASMDPQSAITWAETITNEKMREGSLVNVYKQWYRRDPAAAEASLGNSKLSAEQLQQVLKK